MKILRTAVIGLGRIGWYYHIPAIMKNEGFCFVSAADASTDRLKEAAQKYDISVYSDYKQMLDKEKIDLVVIASPTVFHMEQAVHAMGKGVNVILEKPMACDLEEADSIIGVMKRNGRKLMVYQPHRTTPEIRAIKSVICSNIIGRVYMVKRACSNYFRRNDWQSQKKYSGGMLNNYGAHYIDQTLYLIGSSAKNISCCLKKIVSLGDADDVVKIIIGTNSNAILDIDINMASPVQLAPWIILGEYGSITIERANDVSLIAVKYLKREEIPELQLNTSLAAPGRIYDNNDILTWHEKKIEIDDFEPVDFYQECYSYFALGGQSFVPVEETREVMRIISECKRNSVQYG